MEAVSDNAKTYKSAAKEISKLIRSPRLKEQFRNKTVEWKFIVELASFQGGFWQIAVYSQYEMVLSKNHWAIIAWISRTILVEIETMINSRPLTCVYDNLKVYLIH